MAITSFTAERVEVASGVVWRLVAVSDAVDPTFYWYQEGQFLGSSKVGTRLVSTDFGESSKLEVFDDANTAPGRGYPPRLVLAWEGQAGVYQYSLELWDADAEDWNVVARFAGGRAAYEYLTPSLADGADVLYRVVGYFTNGARGVAREFACAMVRRPETPSVSGVYDSGAEELTVVVG